MTWDSLASDQCSSYRYMKLTGWEAVQLSITHDANDYILTEICLHYILWGKADYRSQGVS